MTRIAATAPVVAVLIGEAPAEQKGRLEFDVPASPELDAVVRLAARVTGARCAVLATLDEVGSCQLAATGPSDQHRYRTGSHFLSSVVAGTDVPFISGDLANDRRVPGGPKTYGLLDPVRGFASIPVVVGGSVVGQLAVLDDSVRSFDEGQLTQLLDLVVVVEAQLVARREARLAEEISVGLHEQSVALSSAQAFSRALLEALPVGVVACDAAGRPTVFNQVTREWHGQVLNITVDPESDIASYHLFEPDGETPLTRERHTLSRTLEEGFVQEQEMVIAVAGRQPRTVLCSGSTATDQDGVVLGAVVLMSDVTQRNQMEKELHRAATHDALTGLPNRRLLTEHLERTLAAGRREGSVTTLFYCDLDGFKQINDQHGHAAGDEVLTAVAHRLHSAVRPGDTVARLGGDEFALLCPGLSAHDAAGLVERVESSVHETIRSRQGHSLGVGISIGFVTSRNGQDASALLAAADGEMFRVKRVHHAGR